jgi:hypothetical protein
MTGRSRKTVYSETEARSMDIDYVPPPERPRQVSNLLRLLCWGLLVFSVVSDLLAGQYEPNSVGYEVVRLIIMGISAAVFSGLCAKMAAKIGRNLDFAWAMGFLFGFIGFGVYWVYYRITASREGKAQKRKRSAKGKKIAGKQGQVR